MAARPPPQSSPLVTPSHYRSFRYAFWPMWRAQLSLCMAGIGTVLVAKSAWTGQPIQRPDLLLHVAMGLLMAVVMCGPVHAFRFRVGPQGLYTFDARGRWQTLPWARIHAVEPAWLLHFPHLRIRLDGERRSFWLPLMLADLEGLHQAVVDAAGAEHPLARALPRPARASCRR